MSYRNGTYIAFDGNDTTDPTKSDMKYYGLLQAWNKSKNYTLTFSDSHKKTYQVRDSSTIKTLQNRLLERMRSSKNRTKENATCIDKSHFLLGFAPVGRSTLR